MARLTFGIGSDLMDQHAGSGPGDGRGRRMGSENCELPPAPIALFQSPNVCITIREEPMYVRCAVAQKTHGPH